MDDKSQAENKFDPVPKIIEYVGGALVVGATVGVLLNIASSCNYFCLPNKETRQDSVHVAPVNNNPVNVSKSLTPQDSYKKTK